MTGRCRRSRKEARNDAGDATGGHPQATAEQRGQFDEDGFFLVEDALSPSEIATLLGVIDELYERYCLERDLGPHEAFQIRNIVAHHPSILDLMEHPAMLPLVVDVMGFNIQLRTSHLDVRPSQEPEVATHGLGAQDGFFPWHSDQPDYGWPEVDGIVPYMEMKIGYYLIDLTEHNSGAICVVRGSHRISPWIDRDGVRIVDPDRVFEVNVRPGTAMVWRTPIQLQLLGELGTGKGNYAGDDPEVHPVSRYWRPQDEDIPPKTWAREQLARTS